MDKKLLTAAVFGAAAAAGAVTVGLIKPPAMETAAPGKEQCYGVAKAGENGCAAANGSHTCGGLSTIDNSGQEWMLVDGGTCLKMGGKLEAFADPAPAEPQANESAPPGD
jgi:uncharacterized membrane protein